MGQGVIYQDRDGTIIEANPAAERILGIPLDQLTGKRWDELSLHMIQEDNSPFPVEKQPSTQALHTGKVIDDTIMGICH